MKAQFAGLGLTHIRAVVPKAIRRYEEDIAGYNQPPANSRKLQLAMGYDEHRVVTSSTTTADMIEFGFAGLIEDGVVCADEIDALVFVSQTPDYILPPTSSVLHGKLGLREDTYCVDINHGCAGYIVGLQQAAMLLQIPNVKKVLLCVGDTLSTRVSTADRNSYPLIGDAAALTLVERVESQHDFHVEIRNRGSDYSALIIPAGGARHPSDNDTEVVQLREDGNSRSEEQLVMAGTDVFNFTQTVVPEFIQRFLEDAQTPLGEVNSFYLHQANAFILKKIAQSLGVEQERLPHRVVTTYGNSSSATVPLAIALSVAQGKTVSGQSLLCGFGVGLSWGAVLTDLSVLESAKIIEMEGA